jgi:hypothetical protein
MVHAYVMIASIYQVTGLSVCHVITPAQVAENQVLIIAYPAIHREFSILYQAQVSAHAQAEGFMILQQAV